MSAAYQPERRSDPRSRTLLSATARDAATQSTISCVVRNLGRDGARLALANTAWLPERFELAIAGKDGLRAACVAWRTGNAAGVRFIDDPGAEQARRRAELLRLRQENDTLSQRLNGLDL